MKFIEHPKPFFLHLPVGCITGAFASLLWPIAICVTVGFMAYEALEWADVNRPEDRAWPEIKGFLVGLVIMGLIMV